MKQRFRFDRGVDGIFIDSPAKPDFCTLKKEEEKSICLLDSDLHNDFKKVLLILRRFASDIQQ
jgi:hypothetical protein